MGNPSHNGTSGSRKPITYSRSATPVSNGCSRSVTGNNDEVKGGEAYDRILQSTRRGIQTSTQRAAKMFSFPRNGGAQGKPSARAGCLKKPSISFANSAQRFADTRSTTPKTKTDMEEAIARSLAGCALPAPSFPTPLPAPKTKEEEEANLAQAKMMSLRENDTPSTPSRNTRSYKEIGGGSTSSATAPYAPLHGLVEVMEKYAKVLEQRDEHDENLDLGKIARIVGRWGGRAQKVIHALEAAETQRIKDLQGQLDFDREIEEKHQKKIATSNKMWEIKLRQKEEEWLKKMDKQKKAYEARITKQGGAKLPPTLQEQTQPRTAQYPPPDAREEVARLTNEIATLKAEHEAKLANVEATHSGAAIFMKQKAERLADQNVELRRTQKAKEEESKKEMENMKKTYEAQIKQLKDETERLAEANRRSREGTHETNDGEDGEVELEKMETDHETQGGPVTDTAGKSAGGSEEAKKQQLNGQATRSQLGTGSGNQSFYRKRDLDCVTSNSSENRVNRRTLHSVAIPRSGSHVSPSKRKLEHGSESRSESASWSPKKARTGSMG